MPGSLGFLSPLMLFGLMLLPAIWWLLRMTPPKPVIELFPPLKILARVIQKEETPSKSPWWLTALRLLMAAAVIIALARPQLNPIADTTDDSRSLVLLVDNSWATQTDWQQRSDAAARQIAAAGQAGKPVALAFSAAEDSLDVGPFDASEALNRLQAQRPVAVPGDRQSTLDRLARAAADMPSPIQLAIVSDGLSHDRDVPTFVAEVDLASVVLIESDTDDHIAITGIDNASNGLEVTLMTTVGAPGTGVIDALDQRGRPVAEAAFEIDTDRNGRAVFNLPIELRNDIRVLRIRDRRDAAATFLLDDSNQRRRIGLIAATESGDDAQPLLAPLYYIERAVEPFADAVRPEGDTLASQIDAAINQRISVLVLADIGVIPDDTAVTLTQWVEAGGTLIRFAGPRLANADTSALDFGEPANDPLLPVRLRLGERNLGGALSWSQPQPIAPYPETSPFAGLAPPRDVTVSRQVLAEPDIDTLERTWANLTDGTPLVTGAMVGRGTVVLFHVTPDVRWSNLPISGSFVGMLSTLVRLSNATAAAPGADGVAATLAPYRILGADGQLAAPGPAVKPVASNDAGITFAHPPGLYGSEEAFQARNLFSPDSTFEPLDLSGISETPTLIRLDQDGPTELRGMLFGLAALLLIIDGVIMLWLSGTLARIRQKSAIGAAAATLLFAALAVPVDTVHAQTADVPTPANEVDEADAISALTVTRLAYVRTGDRTVDDISRAGLEGLSMFLASRTALEPGDPVGVDPAVDELAFFPILYWPVTTTAPLPNMQMIERIDAYMRNGGTILFDTRDRLSTGFGDRASPENTRLRNILADLNVPPLEPVPVDHVLTKSFYILESFPGRYNGGPLWVEASQPDDGRSDRPVRSGDGVTPIMITSNDLAGAWALDETGRPLLPTIPNDPLQRLYAFRAGVNIVMYMLTGNYKADQVHIPALLERLGQ